MSQPIALTPSTARPPLAPGAHPLFGHARDLDRDGPRFLLSLAQRYGDVVRFRLGPLTPYLVTHPSDVQRVLQEHSAQYTKRAPSYLLVRRLAGNGLLTNNGESWLRQRRLAQPAFHRQRIAAMSQAMSDAAQALARQWEAIADGRQVDVAEAMMELTLQVVGMALFGTDLHDEVATVGRAFTVLNAQLAERVHTLNLLPAILPTRRDQRYRAAMRELNAVVYRVIERRRAHPSDDGTLLSILMDAADAETGARMDDRQLRDEVVTMLIAGHETTAVALSWALKLLAEHPEQRSRLQAEVDAVLAGRAPTFADVMKLTYTTQVIEEALRLYPPIWVLSRRAEADDVLGGYRVPRGTMVVISPYVTHRHPAFWPNPEVFDPERFSSEASSGRPRFAHLPFIGGPRQCIGASFAITEATIVLATLVQRFTLDLDPGQTVAMEGLVSLRPDGGLPMRLHHRARP